MASAAAQQRVSQSALSTRTKQLEELGAYVRPLLRRTEIELVTAPKSRMDYLTADVPSEELVLPLLVRLGSAARVRT